MFDWSKPIQGGPLGAGFDYYFGDDVPNMPPYAFIENDRLTCDPIDVDGGKLRKQQVMSGGYIHGIGPGQKDWQLDQVMPMITAKEQSSCPYCHDVCMQHEQSRLSQSQWKSHNQCRWLCHPK